MLRDRKWLDTVRDMDCVVCNATPCEPAHIRLHGDGGIGLKPSDDLVVPLCHTHHAQQHQIGERQFWHSAIGNDAIFMIRCLQAYARQLYATRKELARDG